MTLSSTAFERLTGILDELREKCPWDKKQTMESLRQLSIEELYELSDAILANDPGEIKNELGDLMLHLVFYARIAAEQNWFTLEDVLTGICEKLIYRHPHIYGDVKVKDEAEVKRNWENLKLKKGTSSVLQGVPASLPSLVKAFRIQEKAAGVGFDFSSKEDVWAKVKEEIAEFEEATEKMLSDEHRRNAIEAEFGDILFSLISYGRFLNINADDALERTNRKFIARFKYVESRAKEAGLTLNKDHMGRMEALWQEAKNNL